MLKVSAIAVVSSFAFAFLAKAAAVDYTQEVKPLLAEHCYKCHGASQQKGGLRVDTAAFARKGGERGPAIKPEQSAESLLVQAVASTHPEIPQMPYKRTPLSDAELSLLKRWIDEGALAPANERPETSKHWAFAAPERSTPPPAGREWARNAIDQFVLARLEQEGVLPSPEADRITLLRRLSLDLLGLPPAPEDVDRFLSDSRADAYERLVA